MKENCIPATYAQWSHCITRECGLTLDTSFINQRIARLSNTKDEHTRQFIRCYGQAHYKQVLQWFIQARERH